MLYEFLEKLSQEIYDRFDAINASYIGPQEKYGGSTYTIVEQLSTQLDTIVGQFAWEIGIFLYWYDTSDHEGFSRITDPSESQSLQALIVELGGLLDGSFQFERDFEELESDQGNTSIKGYLMAGTFTYKINNRG